jgi:UV DNA damage endonuclease
MGKAGLRARDGRRAEHAPHLSVSLLLVREVLAYLAEHAIGCYRLADNLAPYIADQRRPEFARQLDECDALLAATGTLAHELGIRLTMHMPMHVALGTPDEQVSLRSAAAVVAHARLLDMMGLGPEGVLVLHIGGAQADIAAALFRFAARYERLPAHARGRVAVEPDEHSFALPDLLRLHEVTGVPVVLDVLHHQINNPARISLGEALGLALATWPRHVRPKVHFSSQRTEAHLMPRRRGQERRVLAPLSGQHADFINPFEFASFVVAGRGLPPFDVMLEAKAADLALLRLREDLARFAPEIAAQVT